MDFLTWPPAGITNVVQFLVFGTCAMMLIGIARAGFGGSIGLLAVPLMVCATGNDPALATGLMLPLLIACDYAAMCYYWRRWNLRAVAMLLPGTALGIVGGIAVLWFVRRAGAESQKQLADAAMMLAIGVISLGFVAIRVFGSLRTRPSAFRPAPWQGACFGTAAGFTSTLAHAAGPITTMYLLPQQMPKRQYVASSVVYYWLVNQLKLAPYICLGMINQSSLAAAVWLVPGMIAGVLLGAMLNRRVQQRQFTGIVYGLLTLAGAQLCYQAARMLWM